MNQRYLICKQCDRFDNKFKICGECKCFMPVKSRIPGTTCPLGKWETLSIQENQ